MSAGGQRPTINDLRKRVGLPTEAAHRNLMEPCGTCADFGGGVIEWSDGSCFGLCQISRERMAFYPGVRSIAVAPTTIAPCWRARTP